MEIVDEIVIGGESNLGWEKSCTIFISDALRGKKEIII